MVNRIEEVRRKRIDAAVEENESRGERTCSERSPDMWDPDFYALVSWKCPVLLEWQSWCSAVTTIIGFSVLILPNIVSIIPFVQSE